MITVKSSPGKFDSSDEIQERFYNLEKRRLYYGFKPFLWSLFGRIGNSFFRREAPACEGESFLNLACGDRRIKGWINADFYRLHNLLWQRNQLPDWFVDLTKPLKCKDNYWDGIVIEHANEHLLYSQNLRLFREVLRILKPGGVLRIVVPDIDRYLDWKNLRMVEPKMARYGSLAEAISNVTQNHAHASVWNEALLAEVLNKVGFVDVQKKEYKVSSRPLMAIDAEGHRWESLYMEASKAAS